MNRTTYLFLLVCIVAVPALAADGPASALDPGTEPLATPAVVGCNAPLDQVLFASSSRKDGGGNSLVTCHTDCGPYNDVECQTTGSCVAVDRNCSNNEPGYVHCFGQPRQDCPPCPAEPECDDGDFDFERTGQCCDCSFGGEIMNFYQCIGGEWVLQSSDCGPSSSCPRCP